MTAPGAPAVVLAVASLVGMAGFLYPFFLPALEQGTDETRAQASIAPLLFAAITGVWLGASPIFLLIMLVGAVFGSSMGFQMGALTLLFSAFVTGGIGPWLPFQMLVSGWIGLTAGWLPRDSHPRRRIATLALFGALWGLLFGALMNLWFWPFSAPGVGVDAGLYWSPGMDAAETVRRYVRFYLVTSLGYDLLRAVGNVVLVVALAGPVLRLLERYRARFTWTPWTPLPATDPTGDDAITRVRTGRGASAVPGECES